MHEHKTVYGVVKVKCCSVYSAYNSCGRELLLCCFLLAACHMQLAAGTSVNYVFEGFSPYSVLRFFDYSDKGGSISEQCLRDMFNYLEGLKRGALWAVKLYDAGSYYAGGAFAISSASVRLHNPNLCRTLLQQYEQQIRQGYWSQLANNTIVPFPVHIIMAQYLLELANESAFKLAKIQQLICFPSSCTNADLQQVLEVYLFQRNHIVPNSTYLRHRIVSDDYNPFYDYDFHVLVTFLCSSIFTYAAFYFLRTYLALLNEDTAYTPPPPDKVQNTLQPRFKFNFVLNYKHQLKLNLKSMLGKHSPVDSIKTIDLFRQHKSGEPMPTIPMVNNNLPKIVIQPQTQHFEDIIEAVSLHNVLYNLVQGDAGPQTGVFVLFTIALICTYIAAQIKFMSNNMSFAGTKDDNLLLKHASYLFDVFFFVSGFRLAYQFFQTFPRDQLNVFQQLMHTFRLLIHKVFCLSLSLTFCVYAEHLLDKYFHHNIAMELPSYDYANCKDNKLTNILYLDTFFPLIKRCMPWTWFMSLEVQFFTVACLILLLAEIQARYALIIGTAIFTIAAMAGTIWELNPQNEYDYKITVNYELTQFNLMFDNICLHAIPYLLGICLGFILHKTNSNINLNVYVFIAGWIALLLILCLFFFGYDLLSSRINQLFCSLLSMFSHIMWSLMLMWIILTGMTQYGEYCLEFIRFPYAHTLEKLSPVVLLITPIVIRLLVFTADAPIYTSATQICAMSIGCLLVIYMFALLLHVLFDGPVCAIMDVTVMKRMRKA